MTDRLRGFIVTLAEDTREDDAAGIAEAIALLRGVCDVSSVLADVGSHMARAQARRELIDTIWAVLNESK
jgi:hypothetical protein